MELALISITALLLGCLRPAFKNRWLRADPDSRVGIAIAFGTLVICICLCVLLAIAAVRGIMNLP